MTATTIQPKSSFTFPPLLLAAAVHVFCLALYLFPILSYHPPTSMHGGPVLDEQHILSADNRDVAGTSDITNVFSNDYWGRPMTSPSSHKSWRPLSILSFRWLHGTLWNISKLNTHRLVNVVTHAAVAECVGLLAVQLLWLGGNANINNSSNNNNYWWMLYLFTKLWFVLHPTHVEATANAANRPHLLAVLCGVWSCDNNVHILLLMLLQLMGLLSCETFVFQMPAIMMTMVAVRWTRRRKEIDVQRQQQEEFQARREENTATFKKNGNDDNNNKSSAFPDTSSAPPSSNNNDLALLHITIQDLLPRLAVIVLSAALYLLGRLWFDTLSIPDGLIRPAENPFYEFQGWRRARNYAYVTSIHVAKSHYLDWVGMSHEYGYNCIAELSSSWTDDTRWMVPLGMIVVVGWVGIWCWRHSLRALLLFLVYASWMATLFPISGIVKVGTFVADRIVVASTVAVSMALGAASTWWVGDAGRSTPPPRRGTFSWRWLVLVATWCLLWRRVHRRTLEWMDSEALLHSSLATCPNSAKSHLEVSKIYSGLYPEKLDLRKSLYHLQMAESIDPTYCDVHQQFAHVFIQQQRYLEFEEQMTKGILCPYSMGGSMDMWNRYWPVAIGSDPSAQQRKQKFSLIIQQAVQEEQRKAQRGEGSSRWLHDPIMSSGAGGEEL